MKGMSAKGLVWLVLLALAGASIGLAMAAPQMGVFHPSEFHPAGNLKPAALQNASNGLCNATNATNMQSAKQGLAAQKQMQKHRNMSTEWHGRKEVRINEVKERIKRESASIRLSYMKAKERYFRLKQEYRMLKKEGKLDFRHEKMFCMAAGDLVLKWFDRVEAAILNSNINESVKNDLIAKLEQEKLAFEEKLKLVNSTDNPQQFREYVRQLREQWRQARITVDEAVMEVAVAKLSRTVSVAEKLELKLSSIAPGNTPLEGYSSRIQMARNYIERAKIDLKNGNVAAARKDIAYAIKSLREAFLEATRIVRALNMRGGELMGRMAGKTGSMVSRTNSTANTARFGQTGQLNVMGNGTFSFSGSGIVVLQAVNATISYTGNLSNSTGFTISGETLTGSGRATIIGQNVSVTVTGSNVHMFVKGKGVVHLSGTGVYWYNNVTQRLQRETLNGSVSITLGR